VTQWLKVCGVNEIPPEAVKVVRTPSARIAVCNVDGEFFAIEDKCTHDGGVLDQGELFGAEIECPRHGARFDVRTGKALTLPAVYPVKTFPVRVEGNEIQVEVD
jgi:3-phenylpropionate/trans-cinnamate dioxygenase ferredoxin subunit